MNNNIKYLLQFNLAMVFMSTSGTFGRMIELPPPVAIWARCFLGGIFLLIFLKIFKVSLSIRKPHFRIVFISSVLLGIHWITYFYALQLSNVALGMLSLFTYPIMTTLLEPIVLKTKFTYFNLFLAILVLIGIFFLVPEFSIENKYTIGILIGLASAVFYSLRNLLMKKSIAQYSGMTLMFYQLLINAFLLIPVLFIFETKNFEQQIPPLLALAIITTAMGHTMFVMSFKKFSVTAVSIMSSVQPLLGMVFAYFMLNEIPANKTLIGGALILATVIAESIRTVKE